MAKLAARSALVLLVVAAACASSSPPTGGDDAPEGGAGGTVTGSGGHTAAAGGAGGKPGTPHDGSVAPSPRDAAAPQADVATEGERPAPLPDAGPDRAAEPPPAGGLCTGERDCTAVIGKLDGFLVDESCKGPRTGADCAGLWCDGKPPAQETTFTLAGPAADSRRTFAVTLRVRGVSECKEYENGRRRVAAQQAHDASGDAWYVGGRPAGLPDTPWNIHGIHVSPALPGQASDYFLNSCGAGQAETHFTWKLDYEAKLLVRGGGTLVYRVADSNCRMIVNCGVEDADQRTACAKPHVVPLTGAVPAPPSGFTQPLTNAQGGRGQFLFIDVVDVREAAGP